MFDGYELDIEKVKSDALEKSTDIKEKNTDKNSNITTIKKIRLNRRHGYRKNYKDEIGYFIDKSEILRYAVAELGKICLWSYGPDTFDCSGLLPMCIKKLEFQFLAHLQFKRRMESLWKGKFAFGDLVSLIREV